MMVLSDFFSSAAWGNELLWLMMLILNFSGILFTYRFFGRIGMYAWVPIAVILANIQVVKTVELFGITSTLGNIAYGTSFLATDILSENHGEKDARKAVGIGFIALVSLTVIMNTALLFEPSSVDFAQESMVTLYSLLPRIALASFIAYGVSQTHDVWAYAFLKRRRPATQWIWLRNNASTMVSQAVDTMIFVTIAFAGLMPAGEFWQIVISTYVLKWIVAAADTPLVYIAVRWKRLGKIKES
jgi:uncharacterized integral membrane protein (TIGR00697 family)